jgi:prepilin-type N-terminal cleavage/methylation domain-containing protein
LACKSSLLYRILPAGLRPGQGYLDVSSGVGLRELAALFLLNPGTMSHGPNFILDPRVQHRLGFTLVETLIVLVMAGMLLGIALPRFANMRQRMQLDTAAHQLAGDLRRAQVEAIKRNQSLKLARTGASTYSIDSIGARTFEGNVTFGGGTMDSVRMRAFGPPVTGAVTFIVSTAGVQKSVIVSAAGRISVQ